MEWPSYLRKDFGIHGLPRAGKVEMKLRCAGDTSKSKNRVALIVKPLVT